MSDNILEKRITVGGNIFGHIDTDEKITPDLQNCLYCSVYNKKRGSNLDYKIPLVSLGDTMKQCPACKIVYLLGDPTK